MKRRAILRGISQVLVAALLLPVAGCGAEPAAPVRPAVWRASDGDSHFWLLGTIHLLPPGIDWRGGAVARAISESDLLITEIPRGDPHTQAASFLKLARVPGLPPIRERVDPALQPRLAAALARVKVGEAALDRMATWAAAMTLGAELATATGGATAEAAPEAVLAALFRGDRHQALESFAGQLGLFAGLSESAQRKLLAAALRPDPAGEYGRLLDAWRKGDPAALERAYMESFAGAPELREALVDARNRAWADELLRRAAEPGTALVAVGAGHLAGPAGLPALLAARGMKVSRVQ